MYQKTVLAFGSLGPLGLLASHESSRRSPLPRRCGGCRSQSQATRAKRSPRPLAPRGLPRSPIPFATMPLNMLIKQPLLRASRRTSTDVYRQTPASSRKPTCPEAPAATNFPLRIPAIRILGQPTSAVVPRIRPTMFQPGWPVHVRTPLVGSSRLPGCEAHSASACGNATPQAFLRNLPGRVFPTGFLSIRAGGIGVPHPAPSPRISPTRRAILRREIPQNRPLGEILQPESVFWTMLLLGE